MKKIFSAGLSKTFLLIPTLIFLSTLYSGAQFLYISGGNQSSMVVCEDGNIKVWGTITNSAGQEVQVSVPTVVPVSISGLKFSQADAGSGYHILALDCDNKVWAYGRNTLGQLGIPGSANMGIPVPVVGIGGATGSQLESVKFVSGLNNASLALLFSGEVVAWGQNDLGQLGRGNTNTLNSYIPDYVMIDANTRLTNVKQVEGGDDNGYALTNDGRVYSWGDNKDASLALGRPLANNTYARLVLDVNGIPLTGIQSIAAGDRHVLALGLDGSVYSWGGNWGPGQLGNKLNGDKAAQGFAGRVLGVNGVGFLTNASYIAAGQASSMVVLKDGSLVTFGANGIYTTAGVPSAIGGNLGQGSTDGTKFSPYPQYAKDCSGNNLKNIKVVSDGDAVTYAVNFSNEIFVMGGNTDGNGVPNGVLGTGNTNPQGCATSLGIALKDCRIPDPCPTPYLGPDVNACSVQDLASITLNTTNFKSYSYKWYYRINSQSTFTLENSADTNIFKPTKLGQYLVEVNINQSTCAKCAIGRDTITLDQPSVNGGAYCKEQSLTFTVPAPAGGIYKWWKSSNGTADSLSPRGSSYTANISQLTPTYSGQDTVYTLYYEDKKVYTGLAGPSATTSFANGYPRETNDVDRNRIYFNVTTKITLDAVSLRLYNYFSNGPTDLELTIFKPDNSSTSKTGSFNVPISSGGPGTAVRFPLGITLDPGSGYYIQLTKTNNSNVKIAFFDNNPGISFPYTSGGNIQDFITLTGLGSRQDGGNIPNSAPGIFNWEISGTKGGACGRTKISITKDCPCNKPAVVITSSTGQTSFCSNTAQSLTLRAKPTPGTPTIEPFGYLYQWYKNGSPLNQENKDSLFVSSSSGQVEYSVKVGHSSLLRPKCVTEVIQNISIQPKITGNNITSTGDTVCQGSNSKLIQGSDMTLIGTGTVIYVWLKSKTSVQGYVAIPNSNSKDYNPGILDSSYYFKRLVVRGVCADTSTSIRMIVDPSIKDPGILSGSSPVICSGSKIPDLIFLNATGGTSPLKYQWESSTNNTTWTVLSQETKAALTSLPTLTQKTYFRRKVSSVKCSSVTASVLVGVDTSVTSNSFDSNDLQTICIGSLPTTIIGSDPKGGIKPNSYKWQQSNLATGPFTDIPNTNGKDFTPGSITSTTYYKRVVTSSGACANNTSTLTAKVTVDPAITSGSIQPAEILICAGTSPILNNLLSPANGTRPYKFKWEYLNGQTWTDIPTANNLDSNLLNAPSINVETQYRRTVLSALKCQATSDVVSVKTTGQMIPGSILLTDTSVCAGSIPGIIRSISAASGGTGSSGIQYQWESSSDASNWTSIIGETKDSLLPGTLTINTYYRRKASNGTGVCDIVYAGPVLITQYKVLNPGSLQSSDTSICDGSNAMIRSIMAPSDGSPAKSYSWSIAYAPDFIFKDTAVNTASLSLFKLTRSVKAKRIVKDACGLDTSANTVTVNVFPKDVVLINITSDLTPTFCSDKPLEVRVSVQKAGNRTIVWEYNGLQTISSPDSILIITKPVNGAKIKAISTTDPSLFCTTPMATSQEITLKINDPISGNTFSSTPQELCLGSAIGPIQAGNVSGGTQPTTYQWLISEDDKGPYLPIPNATGSSLTPSISKTTYFKRIVTSPGVCKTDTSNNFFQVFIDQPIISGKDSLYESTLCKGDTLRFINSNPATGGSVPLTYIWEFSLSNNGPWSILTNQTGTDLLIPKNSLDSLKNTFYFRKRVTSKICSIIQQTFKAVICQKPYVKNFELGRTCSFTDRAFNIIDTVVDRNNLKGDFSTNGYKLLVDSILKPSKHLESSTFFPGTPGNFTYKSKPGYIGKDTVVFRICEDVAINAQCVAKAFYFNVLPVNTPPIVKPETFSTYKNQYIPYGNILSNDSDPDSDTIYAWPSIDQSFVRDSLIIPYKKYINSILKMPLNGEVTMTYKGDLTYKPKEDFVGSDTAIFYVCDYTTLREYCTVDPFYCKMDTVVFDVKPYRIFIPDGFSPNNDGTNDFYVIRSEVPLTIDIKLYNRWGNLVYEKDGYQNDFDGKANRGLVIGEGLPDGTYYLHYNVHDKLIDPNPGFKYITINR